MYLLDAEPQAVAALRETLASLGDSLVVVGGQGLWNVHVHVDDVGAAIEAGIAAGRPHRVRVTHFAEQVAAAREGPAKQGPAGRRVVVVAFGPGLAKLYAEAGAAVLEASVSRRPSTGELLEAILGTGAAEVVVVPNDRVVVPAAEAAVRMAENDHGIRAAVIPTTAQVHGLAAVAVHDPGRAFERDLVEMSAAARHARSGGVTVAARRAITSAGECEPGDVLGAVEGDFVVVGSDRFAVAVEVIERLLGGGGELFTVVAGDGGEELAQRCARHVEQTHPGVEVLLHAGGQQRYPVLFGVE
jgi:dihydroxyacetone kinase-like predicted kinase